MDPSSAPTTDTKVDVVFEHTPLQKEEFLKYKAKLLKTFNKDTPIPWTFPRSSTSQERLDQYKKDLLLGTHRQYYTVNFRNQMIPWTVPDVSGDTEFQSQLQKTESP
jgi:hypothetical protein